MLKVGILGFGGIARSHGKGYEVIAKEGAPVELVALCDINPEQFEKTVNINSGEDKVAVSPKDLYHTYSDLEEMLANEELDVIDICLPTYLHCEYACKLLKRGYNVQCEKPMGLNEAECLKMIEAEKESGKKLMIGMCLRFDAMYLELKKMIDEGIYGGVRSAYFERLSSLPRWGFDGWYHDYERCGGVAMDLHIHDVDMVRFLFGEPDAVMSRTVDGAVKDIGISSQFIYKDKIVSANAEWGMSKSWKFSTGYRVTFEKASVVLKEGIITVYPEEGEPFEHQFTKKDHMGAESEYFASTILGERENTRNTTESAMKTVKLVKKLVESAHNGGKILEV